jgi:uncharacterized protein (DUF885 family)
MRRRHFLIRTGQSALAITLLPRLTGCAGDRADRQFFALRDRYFLKAMERNPVTATYLGGDAYDPSLAGINGRLRDWSDTAVAAELKDHQAFEAERLAIEPGTLSPQARIDHAVLGAQLAFLMRQAEQRRYHQRAIDTYVAEPFRGVDWQIQGMSVPGPTSPAPSGSEGPLRGTEAEWRLVIERAKAIPAYLQTARANLLAGKTDGNSPDHRMVTRDGLTGARANADYFRNALPTSTRGFLGDRSFAPGLLKELAEVSRLAAEAWDGFAGFLGDSFPADDRVDRYAAGEDEYAWRVKQCLRVDQSLEDLFAYGAEQVAHYEAEMFAVAAAVAREAGLHLAWGNEADSRNSTRAVMEALSKQSPRDDDELFRWYRETGERAVAYGREQQLFDIPAEYRLEVTPTPPVLRNTIDAAYYPAPPFRKSGVGRFYLSPTGNDPAQLRLNNRASVADTAVHEGFPGHDWHYKYMTQHAAEISNIRWLTPGAVEDSSSMWQDSMATEGWALYSEELMAEPVAGHAYGFYSAAERLYELQGQLLRAVRVRVDIGIHTGRLSFDEAVDYFTERASAYPGARAAASRDPAAKAVLENADRAIYRYGKWPTQAITYNLGKRGITQLRETLRARDGARFTARSFHERLMRMGTIPAGYFREWFLAG